MKTIYPRILQSPKGSFFLFGPRGAGKSTWLRGTFPRVLRGLRAMAKLPRMRRRVVVFRGDRRQKTADGIELLPVASFLRELAGGSLFP